MNRIEKDILTKASYIFALSNYSKIQFERLIGKSRTNMILCGFPTDLKITSPRTPPKDHIIISVGRFSDPRKNVDMLIRTFEKISEEIPDVKLYVIGKKPSDEKLRSFSTQYKKL